MKEPLIVPRGEERIGYVPNVVYTCGAMIHGGQLIIPYAMSDMATTFASVSLSDLVDLLKRD
ncbi:MAG: glycosidase, partial [Nitrospirales bacterium]